MVLTDGARVGADCSQEVRDGHLDGVQSLGADVTSPVTSILAHLSKWTFTQRNAEHE